MSWPTKYVKQEDDYRHPEVTERLFSNGSRILLLGTSRIGKTTLLNRLRERNPAATYVDLRGGMKSVLNSVKKARDLLLLDEGQALVTTPWDKTQIASLDATLRKRGDLGLVLAGWPCLMKAGAPQELKHLLEYVQDTKWLGPLTKQQSVSMVRREKGQAPLMCSDEVVKAIYRATGGFPNLIADLCDYLTVGGTDLKVPGHEELEGFLVHAWSHANPFQDFYDSLDPILQKHLEDYQRGAQGALQALRRYGVVAEDGSRFKGELFERVWGTGGWWESRGAEQNRGITSPSSPAVSAPQTDTRRSARRLKILAVATEWSSGHGGLSTFNRELCLAMARAKHEVYCYVPAVNEQEREHSKQQGVYLVVAPGPGEERERLHRKPPLPEGVVPDVIIGHGRVTGSAALSLMDHFPKSRRVHFLHMAPGQIEWFKDHAAGKGATETADERERLEIELAKAAGLVAAVGPRLQREFATRLHPHGSKVHAFIPGLSAEKLLDIPPGDLQILLFGRAEDERLKGLDIAARAVAMVAESLPDRKLTLMVRGAPAGKGDELHEYLYQVAGSRGFDLRVKPYSSDNSQIRADIRQSSLVLMPSRSEGFGLVGLEAISAGVPVLLSQESGLAELIGSLSKEMADYHVAPTPQELKDAAPAWAKQIDFVLRDREAAFGRVRKLRELLLKKISWDRSVELLLHELLHEEEMASNM
jgi:glycosyltransferase involved in cell wall biosynthesis